MQDKNPSEIVASIGEEVINIEELNIVFTKPDQPIAYNGFEPSGTLHVAQGLMFAKNVRKLQDAGCKVITLIADKHAEFNGKFEGDKYKIHHAANEMIYVWKKLGIKNVEYVWASELYDDPEYQDKVAAVAKSATLERILRTTPAMGRSETDKLTGAHILYPCMQIADMWHLGVDIAQLGMDQRKVNMLAREIAPKLRFKKPICVHHFMIPSLDGQNKMSKSDPSKSLLMTDTPDIITHKINKAFCPTKTQNPILPLFKHIICDEDREVFVDNHLYFGEDGYPVLEADYLSGMLTPQGLKKSAAKYLVEMMESVME